MCSEPSRGSAVEHLAGRMQVAVGAGDVLAQEHLVRGMRRIGLALVDERRDGVGAAVDNVVRRAQQVIRAGLTGGSRQHHEGEHWRELRQPLPAIAVRAERPQRVVRRQRNEHRAAAALGDEIEAVVEELAEERHPGVERRRQAGVRRHVRNEQAAIRRDVSRRVRIVRRQVAGPHPGQNVGRGLHRRRVVRRLVDDQIADNARIGVGTCRTPRDCLLVYDWATGRAQWLQVAIGVALEQRIGLAQEGLVRGAEQAVAGNGVVVGAGDLAQAERQMRADRRLTRLRHLDLLQDELEVAAVELNADVLRLGNGAQGSARRSKCRRSAAH